MTPRPHAATKGEQRYDKIIVGFDGAEPARDALALARLLARKTKAELLVVNVYSCEPALTSIPYALYQERQRGDADHALASARAALSGEPDAEFRVFPGSSPARGLHELAEEENADLLVVGSCHRGRLGRALIGSTARKLLHDSPCAVGVAPRGYRHNNRTEDSEAGLRIGVAYDGSRDAKEALLAASQLARDGGGSVRIVDVVDASAGSIGLGYGYGYMHGYAEYMADARGAVEEEVAEAKRTLGSENIETEVREGDPGGEIGAASETLDLLFVGSRSYGPVRRVLLGSVSARLIENALCPVVVVPRGLKDEDAELRLAVGTGNAPAQHVAAV